MPVVAITGTFIGMVLAVQSYSQFNQFGLATRLGSIINLSIIRELGPVLAATMLAGRVGSAIAAELFPVGEAHYIPNHRIIDVTYTGLSADRPVIAQLSRDFGLDVSILGAALETIGGRQAGRTLLAVPGDASVALKVIDSLTAQGVTAWEVLA